MPITTSAGFTEKLIHSHAQGKPFLMQQYLQQFVDEELLQTSPQGFSLRNQDNFAIMATQENVWRHRLEHLQATAPHQYEALELAAILGSTFDEHFGSVFARSKRSYKSMMP